MALSANEIFTRVIPEKLKTKGDTVSSMSAVYEFQVSGDQGGTWTVDFKNGGKISAGSIGSADCVVKIADSHLSDIIEGNLSSQMAFMTGKLKVEGNLGLALKLGNIL